MDIQQERYCKPGNFKRDNAQAIEPLTFIIEALGELALEQDKIKRIDLTTEILEALSELLIIQVK